VRDGAGHGRRDLLRGAGERSRGLGGVAGRNLGDRGGGLSRRRRDGRGRPDLRPGGSGYGGDLPGRTLHAGCGGPEQPSGGVVAVRLRRKGEVRQAGEQSEG
jgi:hypothetical protein